MEEELAAILKNYTKKKARKGDRKLNSRSHFRILKLMTLHYRNIYSEPSQISKTELLVVNNFAKAPS